MTLETTKKRTEFQTSVSSKYRGRGEKEAEADLDIRKKLKNNAVEQIVWDAPIVEEDSRSGSYKGVEQEFNDIALNGRP